MSTDYPTFRVLKKQRVRDLYQVVGEEILYTEGIKMRSLEIMKQSKIKTFDSLHIAAAEALGADVMLTTDNKLERMAAKLDLRVRVMNPLKFVLEVM